MFGIEFPASEISLVSSPCLYMFPDLGIPGVVDAITFSIILSRGGEERSISIRFIRWIFIGRMFDSGVSPKKKRIM